MAAAKTSHSLSPKRVPFSCTVNGAPVEVELPADELTLLDVIRDHLGITSPKNGCQPQAQCGCCTVLLDGKPVLACALRPDRAIGKELITLEGLDEAHRQQIASAFVQCGGVQCGFCIPGFAMRAVGLCQQSPRPSRDEITTSLQTAPVPLHRVRADRRQHRAVQPSSDGRAAAPYRRPSTGRARSARIWIGTRATTPCWAIVRLSTT